MTDIAEKMTEQIERAATSRMNNLIAIAVAISAVFVTLFNIKDNNIVQAMSQAQAHSIDSWNFYQAKSTKQHLAENLKSQLELQAVSQEKVTISGKDKLADMLNDSQVKIERYEKEKAEIKLQAEAFEAEYERLNFHDDQYDMAEALISLAMAVFGISALTQKRALFYFGTAMSSLGIFFGMAGFFGLHIHPEWLAKLLG
jgi:hypothetical protein